MRIIGFDPGTATTGVGVIEKHPGRIEPLYVGVIRTSPKKRPEDRLLDIYDETCKLVQTYAPDVVAMERLFFTKNQTTGIAVAKACGVMQLACARAGLKVVEYAPNEVKLAVVGYGSAEKKQVQYMVANLLKLKEVPKPDDAADALAICVCHAHSVI